MSLYCRILQEFPYPYITMEDWNDRIHITNCLIIKSFIYIHFGRDTGILNIKLIIVTY